jgi:WD40 repeat protein
VTNVKRYHAARLWIVAFAAVLLASSARAEGPIAIAEVKHDGPINFEKEILPFLNKNCVACHNTKKAENSLVLETPQSILKGGDSGPAVVAGKSGESLLLTVASHKDEPVMPPADNGVGAVALSSEQLGLLKLWIDEGATGQVSQPTPITWQSLSALVNPIYAVAVTPDGRYAACGRANQIFIYNVASGQLVARAADPQLARTGLYQQQGVAHLDLVQSLAFSPDGTLLASGGYREAKLWRRPVHVHQDLKGGAVSGAQAATLSPDGKLAAAGEPTGAIKLWDLATGEAKTLTGHSAAVTSLRFLPGGAKLARVSLDKTLRLWNLPDGSAAGQIETPAPIHALAILAEGAQIATGGEDGVIRLWTLPADAAGQIAAGPQLTGHAGAVSALAISPTDKTQLISAGADGSVRQWNLANNQQIREIKHGVAVTALAVRGDGKQIASAGADSSIKLWNAADGQPWTVSGAPPVLAIKGEFGATYRLAQRERELAAVTAKVADGKQAVTDAEAKIIATSAAVTATQTAKDAAAKALAEKSAAVKAPTDAKAAADQELAAAQEAGKAATAKAAEAKAAAEKDAQNAELAKAHEEAKKAAEEADKKTKEAEKKVTDAAAALAKATQEATTAEAGNTAALQAAAAAIASVKKAVNDVPLAEAALKTSETALAAAQSANEAAKQAVAAVEKPIRWLSYSADGSQLVGAGDNQIVSVWGSDSGAPVESFQGHQAPVLLAGFAPDGQVVSLSADGAAKLWNPTPAWTLERTIGSVDDPSTLADRVTALAFSPDGKVLATGGGEPSRSGELKLWNVADGALVRALADAHSDTVFGLQFSPDGAFLASSGADRFVKVWNIASGALAKSFEGHTHHVLGVTWKSDGKVLASSGADNVVKVWDFITGDQRRTTQPFGKEVTSLGFVAATPKVFVTSGDKTVRLINTDNGAVERTFAGSNDFMYSSATSADGRIALAGGQDSVLFVWFVEGGQLIKSFPAPKVEAKPVEQTASGS